MFNEKTSEYSAKQGKEIPVWQSDKYKESRDKAIEIIKFGNYGLSEADFWILMNETKSGKMAYTGLIISHNGCLKINDKLPKTDQFRPDCVSLDKDGFNASLVYSYCCAEQGIFEVGEVNAKNCRIDYPYAMAFKRMYDRVVLKQSKLAYSGIYSEVEADEFKRRYDEDAEKPTTNTGKPDGVTPEPTTPKQPKAKQDAPITNCVECKGVITPWIVDGKTKMTASGVIDYTIGKYGVPLCLECAKKRKNANQ